MTQIDALCTLLHANARFCTVCILSVPPARNRGVDTDEIRSRYGADTEWVGFCVWFTGCYMCILGVIHWQRD